MIYIYVIGAIGEINVGDRNSDFLKNIKTSNHWSQWSSVIPKQNK